MSKCGSFSASLFSCLTKSTYLYNLYNHRMSFAIFAAKFYEEVTFFISPLLSTLILLGYYVREREREKREMRNEKA